MENKHPYNSPDLSIRQIAANKPIAASLASENDNDLDFSEFFL